MWENLYLHAGPQGVQLAGFVDPSLKPLTGKTLAEVAKSRGVSPEQAVIDLVLADQGRSGATYFLMNEDNVRRQAAIPWVSFGSDGEASAPEGIFLKSTTHGGNAHRRDPRADDGIVVGPQLEVGNRVILGPTLTFELRQDDLRPGSLFGIFRPGAVVQFQNRPVRKLALVEEDRDG